MIIGVPGSGKQESVIRFLMIAKKLKLKIVMFGVNATSIDNLLVNLLKY